MEEKHLACQECKFWKRNDAPRQSPNYGECRRYAPRGFVCYDSDTEGGAMAWFRTRHEDWCGEFEPRELSPIERARNRAFEKLASERSLK